MKYLLPLLLFLCSHNVKAQYPNLVPNPSFEQNTICPSAPSNVAACVGWRQYTGGSSDYFHSCNISTNSVSVPQNFFGYQPAAHGSAYVGGYLYANGNESKEYVATSISPMQPGRYYKVSASVSLSDNSGWGIDALGVYFYDQGPATQGVFTTVLVTPQISYSSYGAITNSTNWVRLVDTFQADSTYDNMVLGAFVNNNNMTIASASGFSNFSYYYWDSIEVVMLSGLSLSVNGASFCHGDSMTVDYSVLLPALFTSGNTFSIQMSNASGSFASPANLASITGVTSGQVKIPVSATITPGTGYRLRVVSSLSPDTSDNNGYNIVIKPRPIVAATSNSPVCNGATVTLNASALTGSSYTWTGPLSFTSVQQNNNLLNATVAQSGDYIVTASLNGCTAKDTVTVLVKPIPAVPTAGSNSPVCSGNSLNLSAASSTNGVSYNWNGPLSYNSTTQNPTITNTTTSMSGTYSVTATLNGCTSTAATTVATVNLTPATPTASSNSPICAGGVINLAANSTTPGVIYNWSGPNGFVSATQNPTISPAPLNAGGIYNVTADLNGCTSTGSGSTTVVVNNVSSLGIYPSPNDTVCFNSPNASFTAVPFNAGSAPQYQWYKNNNLITGATSISYPATTIADGDSFYCRMTVTGLCADPLVLYSNKVGMTVLPNVGGPSVTITADPGTLLSPWQLVKFTAVATNAGALPKYQWKRNGQDVLGANSNVWSANNLSNGDTIHCVVTSDVWCALPASEVSNRMVVNIKTGITDIDADGKLQLYPNPNNGSFVVHLPFAPFPGGHVSVAVVDALGRSVYVATNQPVNQSRINIVLPVSVAKGVYMLKLSTGDKVYHVWFTVSR